MTNFKKKDSPIINAFEANYKIQKKVAIQTNKNLKSIISKQKLDLEKSQQKCTELENKVNQLEIGHKSFLEKSQQKCTELENKVNQLENEKQSFNYENSNELKIKHEKVILENQRLKYELEKQRKSFDDRNLMLQVYLTDQVKVSGERLNKINSLEENLKKAENENKALKSNLNEKDELIQKSFNLITAIKSIQDNNALQTREICKSQFVSKKKYDFYLIKILFLLFYLDGLLCFSEKNS